MATSWHLVISDNKIERLFVAIDTIDYLKLQNCATPKVKISNELFFCLNKIF